MILEKTVAQNGTELFLTQLRHATAPMHEALEQTPLSTALLRPDVTLNHYTAYLQRMHGVISFCEAQVFPLIENVITDLAERRKLHLIERDLAGLTPHGATFSNPYAPFKTAAIPFALGYMYVVEGSTLGGRVILKQLVQKLPINEQSGGTFFAGYGGETSAKWKSFLQQFGTYVIEQACENETIAGAQHAFNSIARHFHN